MVLKNVTFFVTSFFIHRHCLHPRYGIRKGSFLHSTVKYSYKEICH